MDLAFNPTEKHASALLYSEEEGRFGEGFFYFGLHTKYIVTMKFKFVH